MRTRPLVVAWFAVAGAACSPNTTHDAAVTDATVDRPPPQTLTFVIDRLEIDPNDDPAALHTGLNLDDLYSTEFDPRGCTHYDFFSADDLDQNCPSVDAEHCTAMPNLGCSASDPGCVPGVDNQMPTLANLYATAANFDVRAGYLDWIARSRFTTLVRITQIDDLRNDSSVRVAIYRAFAAFRTECDHVVPGREYSIDAASLAGGTDIDANAALVLEGAIVRGRLAVRGGPTSVFRLPVPLEELGFEWRVQRLQLRADISESELRRGDLGGVSDTERWLEDYYAQCGWQCPDTFRQIIGGYVDIQVDGVCDGSALVPRRFGGVAVGFGVHAVAATISSATPIASMPTSGTCGSPVSQDL